MIELLEHIISIIDSLTPGVEITECTSDPKNVSEVSSDRPQLSEKLTKDTKGCDIAHAKIESGKGKNITPFVSYSEHTDERGRKSVAIHARGPFGTITDMTACITDKDRDAKK